MRVGVDAEWALACLDGLDSGELVVCGRPLHLHSGVAELQVGNDVGLARVLGDSRDERLQIMLAPEELRAVDDFRYTHRMPSRAAAVRELMKRGLAGVKTGATHEHSRSKDFGVLKTANGSGFEPENGTG